VTFSADLWQVGLIGRIFLHDRSCRRLSLPKRPTDISQLAKSVIDEATRGKNPAAVALGRLGGIKGGKARAEKLSPQERKAIAKKAAEKRWSKSKAYSKS
jgi:hypothetical protein